MTNTHEKKLKSKVYSAPRRFDLALLFVVTILYSVLFGILTAFQAHPVLIVGLAGFLSAIGIAQAALFKGKKPRLASMIAGGTVLPIINCVGIAFSDQPTGSEFYLMMTVVLSTIPFGIALGYISGALVGGVFMFAEMLRSGGGVD